MQQRSSRTSAGRYWLWAASTVAVVLIVLLIAATIWFGIPGAIVIIALAFVVFMQILKAWEKGQIPFSTRWQRAVRNIPYYQPSQPSYEQGYQQQPSRSPASSHTKATPKEDHPSEYEQPQTQYPEQMPPMG